MNIKVIIITIVVIILLAIVLKLLPQNITNLIHKKDPKQLELTYEINAGIPFKWEYEIEDETIVEFVKSYVIRDDNKGGKVGASVYTNYVFKGLKEGTTTITFKCVSITGEHENTKEIHHKVKVDKDLNISLE